ncbi:MAG: energy-converting hydrogenase B subunit G, EhbG [Methanobacteriaceae archaeon]|jgi:energy-converting hydrogenase B subunit G|nr:energy-converting hydrogenase B subunit G, EhbG [Methanobacteriaceae archaeon]
MRLYDKLINIIEGMKGSTTNDSISGDLVAELTLISTLLMLGIVVRHVSIFLSIVILLGLLLILITNLPLMPKLKKEQEDSLGQMLYYVLVTLGVLFAAVYWGGNFV